MSNVYASEDTVQDSAPAEHSPPAREGCADVDEAPTEVPTAPVAPPSLARTRELRDVVIRPFTPPADRTLAAIQEWVQGPFAAWMVSVTQALEAMRTEVGRLEGADAAVGRGLLADAASHLADHIRATPAPDDVENDPRTRTLFHDSLLDQTAPVYRQVQADAAACAAEASDAWVAHCAALGERAEVERCRTAR